MNFNEPIFEKTFENKTIKEDEWRSVDMEGCVLRSVDLSSTNLSETRFVDTEFVDCNLSNAKIHGATFQDVTFRHCKLLGLPFDQVNKFGFSVVFENCQLDHSTFFHLDLRQCTFKNSRMIGVDLAEADLTEVSMIQCDLQDAIFDGTQLEKADLRGSLGFIIDPEINKIRGAQFTRESLPGLLQKYQLRIE